MLFGFRRMLILLVFLGAIVISILVSYLAVTSQNPKPSDKALYGPTDFLPGG